MTEITSMRPGNITATRDSAVLKLPNVKVEVSADGTQVVVHSNEGIRVTRAAASAENAAQPTINDDFSFHLQIDSGMIDEAVTLPENTKQVTLNGVTIEQAIDGHLELTVPARTKDPLMIAPVNTLEPGQLTENGVYIATSTDKDGTKRAWFADLADAQYNNGLRLSADFNQRQAYADQLNKEKHLGHSDWVVAPVYKREKNAFNVLREMFNASAQIGGFDKSAQYASSSHVHTSRSASSYVHSVNFGNGTSGAVEEKDRTPFRLVRSIAL